VNAGEVDCFYLRPAEGVTEAGLLALPPFPTCIIPPFFGVPLPPCRPPCGCN